MNQEQKHYALEYESAGHLYSMTIYGTQAEAEAHAENLGTYAPELIVQIIPIEFNKGLN